MKSILYGEAKHSPKALRHAGLWTTLRKTSEAFLLRKTVQFYSGVDSSTEIEANELVAALTATFARRETKVPDARPEVLTAAFTEEPLKIQQWQAYAASVDLEGWTLY